MVDLFACPCAKSISIFRGSLTDATVTPTGTVLALQIYVP